MHPLVGQPDAGEQALESAKKALEGGELGEMEEAVTALTEASHKLAEVMYQQAGDAAGTAGPEEGATPPPSDDEVIDAEYVDVDESAN